MTGRWTVLVCGDRYRRDDGAAHAALDRLADLPRSVEVRRVGQLEPDDLVAAVTSGSCLVVDTVRGVEPGTVIAMPLASLGRGGPTPASTHALPLVTVIGLAEALGADLRKATFLGIGGQRFGLGQGLSRPVERGLDAFAATIDGAVRGTGGVRCV